MYTVYRNKDRQKEPTEPWNIASDRRMSSVMSEGLQNFTGISKLSFQN